MRERRVGDLIPYLIGAWILFALIVVVYIVVASID